MLVLNRPHTNPYFNIAAEEYILKSFEEDVFMLWQNEPSIIVGKHQNTLAEINYQFVKENKIPVVRRISGGGTVFHDSGNLNFTFIRNGEKGKLVDFSRFTGPVVEMLNKMGVPAKFEGKNDLRVNGLKISGNAEHVFKNRVLHHGTLLFSSDLNYLNKAIKAQEGMFEDKAVKSNRSEVANISDFLSHQITIEEFKDRIIDFVNGKYRDTKFYSLTENDILAINKLVAEKYSTWKWNFGYSPEYTLHNRITSGNVSVEFLIKVKNGTIRQVEISGGGADFFTELPNLLKGVPHEEKAIESILKREYKAKGLIFDSISSLLQAFF